MYTITIWGLAVSVVTMLMSLRGRCLRECRADWVLECVNHEFTDLARVDRVLDAWEQDPRSVVKDTHAIAAASVTQSGAGLVAQTIILFRRHGKLTVVDPM